MTLPMPQTSQRDIKVVIFDDSKNFRQMNTTKVNYDENKRDEIKYLLQDVGKLVNVDPENLLIYEKKSFISGIKIDSPISDYQNSFGDVYIRIISDEEVAIPNERRVLTEVEYEKYKKYY